MDALGYMLEILEMMYLACERFESMSYERGGIGEPAAVSLGSIGVASFDRWEVV